MRRSRVLPTALAVFALLFAVLALITRNRPITNLFDLVVTVGSPFVPLIGLTGLTLAVVARRVLLSIVAVAVVVATMAVQVQWYYFDRSNSVSDHADIRVLSSNLRLGRADASSFVRLANESADVITVSELTPAAVERFSEAGLDETFPHSNLDPKNGASGIGIYSRFPLAPVSPGKPRDYTMAAARIDVPDVRLDPLIASVHVESPVASEKDTVAEWRRGIAAIKVALDALAVGSGSASVIVAGDFNSTPDMRQFRQLLTNGYHDAVQQTGAGLGPTFPSRNWHPPLLTIDHVLTRNSAASSIKTVYIPGSDHRALLATVEVPLDPTAS